jgi:hypothetical protein
MSYGQKKGRESNWQFDSQPLEVGNRPDFFACRWHVAYCWKTLNTDTTLLQTSSQSEVYTRSYGALKLWESQLKFFWDSHLGVLGQNAIWMWALRRGIEYTIRGKVVASSKSGPWWVLWIRVCLWFILTPKVLKLCTNQLVVWFCAGLCE